ncbi:MAG: phosphatidate cytidylyltransferase, partial [Pirellulales bacterium]|nr:phosphatidate cytidylyltransferase [Pirellulales bacterium]
MLRWRLLLGAVLIAALVGLVWLDHSLAMPGAVLFGVALMLTILAAQEVVSLLAAGGYRPLAGVIYGGSLLVVLSNAVPLFIRPVSDEHPLERLGWPLLAFTLSFMAALAGEMRRYRQPGGVIANVGLATFGVAYVGLLLSFTVQLRMLGGSAAGLTGLLALVIVVKMGDTGAYTVGRL